MPLLPVPEEWRDVLDAKPEGYFTADEYAVDQNIQYKTAIGRLTSLVKIGTLQVKRFRSFDSQGRICAKNCYVANGRSNADNRL